MVTDAERDYMYKVYATDKTMRLNVGIRRRLAPSRCMDNDRRRIQMLNILLMSLPGTPVLYYGDEIGMGDNIYLGDRNGEFGTPMQWSEAGTVGFLTQRTLSALNAPLISNSVYGYHGLSTSKPKNARPILCRRSWMKRLLEVKKVHAGIQPRLASNFCSPIIVAFSLMYAFSVTRPFWS